MIKENKNTKDRKILRKLKILIEKLYEGEISWDEAYEMLQKIGESKIKANTND